MNEMVSHEGSVSTYSVKAALALGLKNALAEALAEELQERLDVTPLVEVVDQADESMSEEELWAAIEEGMRETLEFAVASVDEGEMLNAALDTLQSLKNKAPDLLADVNALKLRVRKARQVSYRRSDAIERATESYLRFLDREGLAPMQPSASGSEVVNHKGRDYVILRNVNGVLAVYNGAGGGRIRRMKSVPDWVGA